MGSNYLEFLIEAFRIIKLGGYLIIAEVVSRISGIKAFIELITCLGFKLKIKVRQKITILFVGLIK